MERLRRIRLRMAAWYALSTGALLFVLGSFLFLLLVRERSAELDHALRKATLDVVQAAAVITPEAQSAERIATTAIDELSTSDTPLYLFDDALRYYGVQPTLPVSNLARRALVQGSAQGSFTSNDQTWRMAAQAFAVKRRNFVVVAIADESVLDRHYLRLLELFGMAALVGILLVGLSTYYFSGGAIQPIQSNVDAMRRFMADAAHELRTPVAAVRTHAEVALQREHADRETVATLQIILNESGRLTSLVSDLLTLARADAGERTIERTKVFLDDVVSDAIVGASALARQRGIELKHGKYEQAAVIGDARLLHELITILLENALKFTQARGKVVVDVFTEDRSAVAIVTDTGIGIASDAIPHIFERFYRSEEARTQTTGAGLGLSIAQWIAELHGGSVVVSSKAGEGSRFEVRFPAAS